MPDQPNADPPDNLDAWIAAEERIQADQLLDELTSRVAVLEAENERLREQVKQLQVYGNMERRRAWHGRADA